MMLMLYKSLSKMPEPVVDISYTEFLEMVGNRNK